MDDELDPTKLTHPIIFKLEAEGAEPEVLEGAENFLTLADYVTVDCGYERGEGQDHTFIEVNNILSSAGYRIVFAQFGVRVTLLFQASLRKN